MTAVVLAFRTRILRAAGWALVVDEAISRVDVIVVPDWAGAAGAIDAADLVHAGTADRVAVIPGPPRPVETELARRGVEFQNETEDLVHLLHALGVANVDIIENQATGTESEGEILPPWCDQRRVRTVLVLSPPDHARRVRRVLHRSMRRNATVVIVRSARFSSFDPDGWWHTREGVRTEIVELQKLLLDIARHPVS